MKYGIVSDTHSNLHAFRAVLEHMDFIGVDKKVHCGDLVGYGPNPDSVLELTLTNFNYIMMGNHDLAVVNPEESLGFNPQAKKAVDWTRSKMSDYNIEVLSHLPDYYSIGDVLFIHGNPSDKFGYIIDHYDALEGFSNPVVDYKVAFVGHTHVPFIWFEKNFDKPKFDNYSSLNNYGVVSECTTVLPKNDKSIINVGSVGQSRDGDPRATYAIYDTEENTVTHYKVPYPIDRAIGAMQRAGFEDRAWQRLMYGK